MNGTLMLLAGNSNPVLFNSIVASMKEKERSFEVVDSEVGRFSDGEPKIVINSNIRGNEVFIVQSTCPPVAQNFVELCLLIDACRRASASHITAVIPYYGFGRQDRKKNSREPISAAWAAQMIKRSGAHRIISLDLHSSQIQGFFNGPFDNLYSRPVFIEFARQNGFDKEDIVVVAPDSGAGDRARGFATRLNNAPVAIIDKRRPKENETEVMNIIGRDNVSGREVIIYDDMSDTSGTLCKSVMALAAAGAKGIRAFLTHPVLSGDAVQKISATKEIKELFFTDTIPLSEAAKACGKIKVLSIASLLGEAIWRGYQGESVSDLFK
ncbi:MAG: ribose-phosphate pyrophosphokinase [bacterium]|nr:ribose-phosphate pyrophosphokinase [bacterium]